LNLPSTPPENPQTAAMCADADPKQSAASNSPARNASSAGDSLSNGSPAREVLETRSKSRETVADAPYRKVLAASGLSGERATRASFPSSTAGEEVRANSGTCETISLEVVPAGIWQPSTAQLLIGGLFRGDLALADRERCKGNFVRARYYLTEALKKLTQIENA